MSKLLQKMKSGGKDSAPAAASTSPDPPATLTTSDAYSRVLKDYSLLMEYKRLKQLAPTGIYVLPAADSLRRQSQAQDEERWSCKQQDAGCCMLWDDRRCNAVGYPARIRKLSRCDSLRELTQALAVSRCTVV